MKREVIVKCNHDSGQGRSGKLHQRCFPIPQSVSAEVKSEVFIIKFVTIEDDSQVTQASESRLHKPCVRLRGVSVSRQKVSEGRIDDHTAYSVCLSWKQCFEKRLHISHSLKGEGVLLVWKQSGLLVDLPTDL